VARRTVRSRKRSRTRFRLRLPSWLPIAAIVVAIVAVLGVFLAFARGTSARPSIGDHIHAALDIYVCGQKEPDLPLFEAGVHTHGDGLIHIHPQSPSEEGTGASVGKFFQYGGWELSQSTLTLPAATFKVGDPCPDGQPGVLRMLKYRLSWRSTSGDDSQFVDECSRMPDADMQEVKDFPGYVPKDGDCLHLVFGPAGAPSVYGTPTPAGTPGPTVVPEGP
jgi:hypothetical protein